jgi:hypothetical protein
VHALSTRFASSTWKKNKKKTYKNLFLCVCVFVFVIKFPQNVL